MIELWLAERAVNGGELTATTGRPVSDLCVGCFTGIYPRAITEAADEDIRGKVCGPVGNLRRVVEWEGEVLV